MTEKKPVKTQGLQGSQAHAKTRLLLALWDMGGAQKEVKKSELTRRVQRTGEKAGDYQSIYEHLEQAGAIALAKTTVSLETPKGLEILAEGLKNTEFEFNSQIGAKTANALLKWIREQNTTSNGKVATAKATETTKSAIASYEEFKTEVLALFEKLDKGHSYSGLVPIWHLRQEFGERINREQFNNWMMEMQAQQLFYLQSGEARGATADQKRDSIQNEIRGLLFFVSQPS